MTIENADGERCFQVYCVVCPNEECKRFTLNLIMHSVTITQGGGRTYGDVLRNWNLIPTALIKNLPDYIPKPIVQDYQEACSILEGSPKASATLARRCLQGMIRDFWDIRKDRLIDEVNALKDKVHPLTWQAIDAVRKVGNIGAHMEKYINLIIDVDPAEGQKLIQLIELLIDDWYITRHEREKKLKEITEIAETKDVQRKSISI